MRTTGRRACATGGRSSKSSYRPDLHPALASFFAEQGLTDAEISSRLSVSRKTLYTWRKEHSELEEALHNSKEKANAMVEAALFKKALSGDVAACVFYLCNRSPSRWSRNGRLEVQVSGAAAKGEISLEEAIAEYGESIREATRVALGEGVQNGDGDSLS